MRFFVCCNFVRIFVTALGPTETKIPTTISKPNEVKSTKDKDNSEGSCDCDGEDGQGRSKFSETETEGLIQFEDELHNTVYVRLVYCFFLIDVSVFYQLIISLK